MRTKLENTQYTRERLITKSIKNWNSNKDKLTRVFIKGVEVYLLHEKETNFSPAYEHQHWVSVVIDGIGPIAKTPREPILMSKGELIQFFVDTIEKTVLKVLLEPKKLTIERRQYNVCTKYYDFVQLEDSRNWNDYIHAIG